MPIMSAMPTGSFAPDSPSMMVPARPRTSRPLRTENVTAGSVGAMAAPSRPLVSHEKSSTKCAASATSPAVANVPRTPSERIGTIATAARCQPMCMPPSNRITISATTAIRSTVTKEIASSRRGETSEAIAAARRNSAALGIANRSVIVRPRSASENPAETMRMISPKSAISFKHATLGKTADEEASNFFLTIRSPSTHAVTRYST